MPLIIHYYGPEPVASIHHCEVVTASPTDDSVEAYLDRVHSRLFEQLHNPSYHAFLVHHDAPGGPNVIGHEQDLAVARTSQAALATYANDIRNRMQIGFAPVVGRDVAREQALNLLQAVVAAPEAGTRAAADLLHRLRVVLVPSRGQDRAGELPLEDQCLLTVAHNYRTGREHLYVKRRADMTAVADFGEASGPFRLEALRKASMLVAAPLVARTLVEANAQLTNAVAVIARKANGDAEWEGLGQRLAETAANNAAVIRRTWVERIEEPKGLLTSELVPMPVRNTDEGRLCH